MRPFHTINTCYAKSQEYVPYISWYIAKECVCYLLFCILLVFLCLTGCVCCILIRSVCSIQISRKQALTLNVTSAHLHHLVVSSPPPHLCRLLASPVQLRRLVGSRLVVPATTAPPSLVPTGDLRSAFRSLFEKLRPLLCSKQMLSPPLSIQSIESLLDAVAVVHLKAPPQPPSTLRVTLFCRLHLRWLGIGSLSLLGWDGERIKWG